MAANIRTIPVAEENPLHGGNHNNLIPRYERKLLRDEIDKIRSTLIIIVGIVIEAKDT
jgi:hypothetical protein